VIVRILIAIANAVIIVIPAVIFLDLPHKDPWIIILFVAIILLTTFLLPLLEETLNKGRRRSALFHRDIPLSLSVFAEEVRRELGLTVRLAFFVFDRHKDLLLIPGDCSYTLEPGEETVEFEEGEGMVGYLWLFRDEIDSGISVDMTKYQQTEFAPRLRKPNLQKVHPGIKWIIAWKVCTNRECYGILSVDSTVDERPSEQTISEISKRIENETFRIVRLFRSEEAS
jgi:hypothetical protein